MQYVVLFFITLLLLPACSDSSKKKEIALLAQPSELPRGAATLIRLSTLNVNLRTKGTHLTIEPSTGLVLGELGSFSGSDIGVNIQAQPDAALGERVVTVETEDMIATGTVRIVEGSENAPSFGCHPSSVKQGETETITITGIDTAFTSESAVAFDPSEGLAVGELTAFGSKSLEFVVAIASEATLGVRQVTITTGTEIATGSLLIDRGNVANSASVEFEPSEIQAGATVSFIATGTGTHFSAESRVEAETGSGISIAGVSVASETELTFQVQAEASAAPGQRAVTIISPFGQNEERVVGEVRVTAAPRMVAEPDGANPGTQGLDVRFIGTNTHFDASSVLQVDTSSGVTVRSQNVVNAALIEAVVDIAGEVAPGEVTFSVVDHSPPVAAAFTIYGEDDGGPDSDAGEDDGGDVEPHCEDFEVDPAVISVGRYGVSVRIRGDGTSWTKDTNIWLIGALDHIYLDGATITTSRDIHLTVTAGLFAAPQDLEIHITEGGETLCGKLSVLGEEIHETTVPSSPLPTQATYASSVDALIGDWYEFYKIEVEPNDTLVFHAIPEDRVTLDVVLRMIDSTGDEPLLYVNDETTLGVDARFVHYFAEGGTYYVGVGVWGESEYGNFDFHIYRLTHNGVVAEGAADNDLLSSPETIGQSMPFVLHGTLSDPADVDVYEITLSTPAAIDVVSRRLGPWQGSTADTVLTLYDTSPTELDSNDTWYEVPITEDPRLFVDSPGTYLVEVAAEESTSGFYALNVRPRVVINEVDNRKISSDPFVELLGPDGFNLSNHQLCTYGPDGGPVDTDDPCVWLDGKETNAGGYFVLRDSDLDDAETLNLPLDQPGAVVLLDNGKVVDKVQYGAIGTGTHAEGDPAEVGTRRTIGRGAGVDTNDNWFDFIYMGDRSPGMPNDRTCQAAVPPYMEPEG